MVKRVNNNFLLGDLDPGDLYTIDMTVESQGVNPVYRNYTFLNSTFPVLPSDIQVANVTPTSVKFSWTPPVGFYEQVETTNMPRDGSCPCYAFYPLPSEITILNLTPGQEYDFTFLTVGNYGKNSSTITVTQSLYTDDVTSYNTVPSVNRIEFNIQLGSGLGRNVRVDLTSDDYPQFLRTTFDTFRLQRTLTFDELTPGTMYRWTMTSKSLGSNPLLREYGPYVDSTLPAKPLTVNKAAGVMSISNTFQLDVGQLPHADFSTTSIRLNWVQKTRVEHFKVKLLTLASEETFDVEAGGWSQELTLTLEPGTKYDFEIIPVSHGKEGESLLLSESTYPESPVENATARSFSATALDMDLSYVGTVEKVHVRPDPPEGNCAAGCEYPAPVTTLILLTQLTPGQHYDVTIQAESNGLMSADTIVSQNLIPGTIAWKQVVARTETSLLEFQIESGVGSSISVEYTGKLTGDLKQDTFIYKLTNKHVLPTIPGESYNLTITLAGRGSNPLLQVVKDIEFHTYSSPISEDANEREVTSHNITIEYSTIGIFSELVWQTMPANSGCPCVITVRSGRYTIGGSDNQLTAGAEYSIYAQSKTSVGLLSQILTIVQSTYVDRMTNPVFVRNSTAITLNVMFESGVGSSVDCLLNDLQGSEVESQMALDFSLDFTVHFGGLPPNTCFEIELHAHSLGSSPVTTSEMFPACTRPPTPTEDDPMTSTRQHFTFHLGSTTQEDEKYVFYEWFQEEDILNFNITILTLSTTQSVYVDTDGWEYWMSPTLKGGENYTIIVRAVSVCCGSSFPLVIEAYTTPYPVQNVTLSSVEYGEDFLDISWDIIDNINDNVTVYVQPEHLNGTEIFEFSVNDPMNVFTRNLSPLEFGAKYDVWVVSFSYGKASKNSTFVDDTLYPDQSQTANFVINVSTTEFEVTWPGNGFYGKSIHTINVTGNPTFVCDVNSNENYICKIDLKGYGVTYPTVYEVVTSFESNSKQTPNLTLPFISPVKRPMSVSELNGLISVQSYYYFTYFYDPDDPELAVPPMSHEIYCNADLDYRFDSFPGPDTDPLGLLTGRWQKDNPATKMVAFYGKQMVQFEFYMRDDINTWREVTLAAEFCYARAEGYQITASPGSMTFVTPPFDPEHATMGFAACISPDYRLHETGTDLKLKIWAEDVNEDKCYLPDVNAFFGGNSSSPDEKCFYSYHRTDCTTFDGGNLEKTIPLNVKIENLGTSVIRIRIAITMKPGIVNKNPVIWPNTVSYVGGTSWL
ncbi:uncharacterized protein LOC142342936 [Convolutriloba macropyga]|uniref:uncharacterized protein LOC142342936 n=1 Tax=Convolutriloba macropyga TaxID=536237 RepID=UPI003F51C24D